MFGSYARGTQSRKSDIDLLIVCETDETFFRRHRDFLELYEIFQEELDLLIYTPLEWEEIKERTFFKKILEEGKIIYERGKG